MRLIRRLFELAIVIFVISLFMKNSNQEVSVHYFGLPEGGLTVQFWELVTFCVALGIIIAAIADFISQMQWIRERSKLRKTDKEHQKELDDLNRKIEDLEAENRSLAAERDKKQKEIEDMKSHTEESTYDASMESAYAAAGDFGTDDETEKDKTGV